MSKLTKGLIVGTLAAGIAALGGATPVSASSYSGHDYKPMWGGYSHHGSSDHNSVSFHENYDKASSFFYNLKQEDKKHDSEHYDHKSMSHNNNGWGNKWGGSGNSVHISYNKDSSNYMSRAEQEKKHMSESYDSKYKQSNNRSDFGGWGRGAYSSNNVSASVNFQKEYDYAASVKAVAAHSSSVNTSTDLKNYGPHGGYSNSVSAHENYDNYSKVESSVAEKVKQQASESYNSNNMYANNGGWNGWGGTVTANNTSYKADSSYEASREVKYMAEEKSSYSSGFDSESSSYNKGYDNKHHDDKDYDKDYDKKHYED